MNNTKINIGIVYNKQDSEEAFKKLWKHLKPLRKNNELIDLIWHNGKTDGKTADLTEKIQESTIILVISSPNLIKDKETSKLIAQIKDVHLYKTECIFYSILGEFWEWEDVDFIKDIPHLLSTRFSFKDGRQDIRVNAIEQVSDRVGGLVRTIKKKGFFVNRITNRWANKLLANKEVMLIFDELLKHSKKYPHTYLVKIIRIGLIGILGVLIMMLIGLWGPFDGMIAISVWAIGLIMFPFLRHVLETINSAYVYFLVKDTFRIHLGRAGTLQLVPVWTGKFPIKLRNKTTESEKDSTSVSETPQSDEVENSSEDNATISNKTTEPVEDKTAVNEVPTQSDVEKNLPLIEDSVKSTELADPVQNKTINEVSSPADEEKIPTPVGENVTRAVETTEPEENVLTVNDVPPPSDEEKAVTVAEKPTPFYKKPKFVKIFKIFLVTGGFLLKVYLKFLKKKNANEGAETILVSPLTDETSSAPINVAISGIVDVVASGGGTESSSFVDVVPATLLEAVANSSIKEITAELPEEVASEIHDVAASVIEQVQEGKEKKWS